MTDDSAGSCDGCSLNGHQSATQSKPIHTAPFVTVKSVCLLTADTRLIVHFGRRQCRTVFGETCDLAVIG